MNEDVDEELDSSQLFLLRLWANVDDGAGDADKPDGAKSSDSRLQGKVMHVLSGKGSNFNDWPALLSLLTKMMPNTNNSDEETA